MERTADASRFTYIHLNADTTTFAQQTRQRLDVLAMLPFAPERDQLTWEPGALSLSAEQVVEANDAVTFHRRDGEDTLPWMELGGAQAYLYVTDHGALRMSLLLDGVADWLSVGENRCVPVEMSINGATVLDTTRLGSSGEGIAADPIATIAAIYRLWHTLRTLYGSAAPAPVEQVVRLITGWFTEHGMPLPADPAPVLRP
ncbi:hypothetical protein ACFV1N_48505 [Streptosporangium canum]|uniref:hypothetical protein n=1 Tax=Streptosporangium canum TaxID=324952 RepID=UPI0036836C57